MILLPLVVADGFKDHQLKLGYENGEYRLIRWLNKIRGSDRSTSQSESQFDPINIEITTPEIQYNTSNFTQTHVFDSPQLAKATYSSVPQLPNDTSSSKSSFHSVEALEARPFVSSLSSPSYRDYFYLKWFHGSPKATYFNETAAADKPTSVLDSKMEHGRHPTVAALPAIPESPAATTNQEFDVGSIDIDYSDTEFPLLSSDSLLGKVLGKIKQMMPVKTQKLDYAPLKFYDEPPKPQFTLPLLHQPTPPLPVHNNVQQVPTQPTKELRLPVVPVQPVHDEVSSAILQSPQQAVMSATENNQPQTEETSTSPPQQNLPSKEDSEQQAEPSSTPASTSFSNQPESKDSISERMSTPLMATFYYPGRPTNNPFQPEEPAYSSLELAFNPLIPAYP